MSCNNRVPTAVSVLAKLVQELRAVQSPPLGPALKTLSGSAMADAVVRHRAIKHHPTTSVEPGVRRVRTIAKTIKYDAEGLTSFDYRDLPQPYRGYFLTAKHNLEEFFRGMRQHQRFSPPSGETCVPSQGHVDLMNKLSDPTQWCVSLTALPYAAGIMYNHRALRAVVKHRFRAEYQGTWRSLLEHFWCTEEGTANRRFRVFTRMLKAVCTIQGYSRFSTVPKNAEWDRTISMEPLFNMIAQLAYAQDIRSQLRLKYGYDLDTRAALHKGLVRHAGKATIDFSDASNSNWMCVIRSLYPASVVRVLDACRSPIVHSKDIPGEFHYWNMLSPMGCGFTFEVMTVTLLHLARVLDPGATVFGDDVIIDAKVSDEFIRLSSMLGWVVNEEKTYTSGNFRESCGAFFDLSTGTNLVSYEMQNIETELDIVNTANKIWRILDANQISIAVRQPLLRAWYQLVQTLPHVVWRSSDDYRMDDAGDCRHSADLPDGVCIVPSRWFKATRWRTSDVELMLTGYYHREVTIASAYVLKHELADYRPATQVQFACYMYKGHSYTPLIRGTPRCRLERGMSTASGVVAYPPLCSFI